jgi:DNA-binding transcriptional ArsR family regulator
VILHALAVPLRHRIFRCLVSSPHSVNELVDKVSATQPAVSQHLRVLADSALVDAARVGSRRVYRVRPDTLAEFRDYVSAMWDDALRGFADFAARPD